MGQTHAKESGVNNTNHFEGRISRSHSSSSLSSNTDETDGGLLSKKKVRKRRNSTGSDGSANSFGRRKKSCPVKVATTHGEAAILELQQQVQETFEITRDNVEVLMGRGNKLQNLDQKVEKLKDGGGQFKLVADKLERQATAYNRQNTIVLSLVFTSFLFAIVSAVGWSIYSFYKQSQNIRKAELSFLIYVTCRAASGLFLVSALMVDCLCTPEIPSVSTTLKEVSNAKQDVCIVS